MRHVTGWTVLAGALAMSGCVTPVPPADPHMAWIDLRMVDGGKVLMAERLDDVRLEDGRFFQVAPGAHELMVRFDFEVYGGGGGGNFDFSSSERLCYLTLRYDGFKPGERYRIEARSLGLQPMARLYDSHRQKLAEDSEVHCLL